jgi:8-amino-7-oxononanoate synthase
MGTLGKAAGSYGAFVAGAAELSEYLVSRSRAFVYSTALPPPVVAAAAAAVELIGGPEGERLRAALSRCAARLRDGLVRLGFDVGEVPGPIFPLFVGDPRAGGRGDAPPRAKAERRMVLRAVALSEALLARGVLARAMRYPTVPRGTERLRLVASAAHDTGHIDRALQVFEAVRELV